jgi:hypothetical protein
MKKNYNSMKALLVALSLASMKMAAQTTYCSASIQYPYDDEIFNVSLGTLNNTSSCGQTGGGSSQNSLYSDYTSMVAAPNLTMGSTYNLSVTVGQCGGYPYSGYVGVWIDYNGNGSFTDMGEQVYMSNYTQFQISGTTVGAAVSIPWSANLGLTRMRVIANEGNIPNPCGTSGHYYGEVEDYMVDIKPGPPCSGIPAANSVVPPAYVLCPGEGGPLTLANTYSFGGITYQWQSSTTSSVGPFTNVSGATNLSVNSPTMSGNTWYQAVITCTNGGGSVIAAAGLATVQAVTLSEVPYFEGFESIPYNNRLPNCSWAANSLSNTCLTYTQAYNQNRIPYAGSKFASFYYSPSGTNFFYTNGIKLYAGVTYSASMFYTTEYYSYTNWSDLSILLGTSQSSLGLTLL